MGRSKLRSMLDEMHFETPEPSKDRKVLILDGLNLFFRNFAMLNIVNSRGTHIGGVGGFLRSLGAMIRQHEPTEVYIIFDGKGSSNNRKNILPEYKSGRNLTRLTNWDVFEDLEEEDEAQVNQTIRVIEYLQTLPLKLISLDKSEADDIIAYMALNLNFKPEDRMIIISSDQDYLQLINQNVVLYRPMEKKYYTEQTFKEQYNMPVENFIIYKTLLGDTSDKIPGLRGLGPVKLDKLFPQIREEVLSLEDVYKICEENVEKDVLYARFIQHYGDMKKYHEVMDLSDPMIDKSGIEYIREVVNEDVELNFESEIFLHMYKQDELGKLIRNVNVWVKEIFEPLANSKIEKIKF